MGSAHSFEGFRQPYEIIVVDGGSTDGAIDWLVAQCDIITIVQHNREAIGAAIVWDPKRRPALCP